MLKKISDEIDTESRHIWFHFASLGEFEQGRPVLEKIKKLHPEKKIIITFFSPSGYEIRKNYALADHVFYLPLDTARNASEFIDLIKPEFAVFTKYDYWLNYFTQLHKRGIRLYVISAIFRESYSFFKWYGVLSRKMLRLVTLIFVQDEHSREVLSTIGVNHVVVNGDTRFDRVAENAANPKSIPLAQEFANGHKVLIAGSTWPEDEKLLAALAAAYPGWKFIIAPHEVHQSKIEGAKHLFGDEAVLFSEISRSHTWPRKGRILIIDNIGMLSSLYQYSHIAYIGGAFGAGLHNTLEAAAFNLPVLFGPDYARFREAVELINVGAAFSVSNITELEDKMAYLQNEGLRVKAGDIAGRYVRERTGATNKIIDYISIYFF